MEQGGEANISRELSHILRRGVAEVIVEEEMTKLLRSGRKLRLKEGFDPSFPDIHLGHMVTLKKLRHFQELGHQVVLIVGDWTAQIGDPSGVSATRPMLSAEQVKGNAETYMQQFFKVVDRERTEVRWQSEWFGKFNLAEVIQLTSKFTVAQLLAREDFSNRYSTGRPIAVTELLYPLLQAYDSVVVEADVEFGGVDQKFNLLVGRELQSMMGQPSQQCFMTPLLIGTDGTHKMSKSLGNYIGIAEPPDEIYGKVMSLPDSLILQYFELLTDVTDEQLDEFKQQMNTQTINPMLLKKRLAGELVMQLYNQKAATEAEDRFAKVFQERELPDEIEERHISFKNFKSVTLKSFDDARTVVGYDISRLLVEINLAKSRSEANRLISQGAISIDGKKIGSDTSTANTISYVAPLKSGSIIKAGKRRFARVINTDI